MEVEGFASFVLPRKLKFLREELEETAQEVFRGC